MTVFAVTRTRGPGYRADLTLEQQRDWRAHAEFMNGLLREGFIAIGGPLEGTDDVLLIVRAADAQEIERRFAADPWSGDLLTIKQIVPWNLRLGSLDR